jgi:hypothetical protein
MYGYGHYIFNNHDRSYRRAEKKKFITQMIQGVRERVGDRGTA